MASKKDKRNQKRKETQQIAREKMAIARGEDPASRKRRRKEQRGMKLSTFIAILIIIFVVMRGLASALPLLQANKDNTAGPVTSVVVKMEKGTFTGGDQKYPVFEYKVDGKTYQHKSMLVAGKSGIKKYDKGDTEPIYYNEAKPKEAFSQMEMDNKWKTMTGYIGIVALILVILMLGRFANYMANRGQQVLKRAKRG